MPLYEYICKQCQHEFELLVSSSTKLECPKCQSSELTKKLSVFATTSGTKDREPAGAPCGSQASACGHGGCPYSGGYKH